FKNIVWTQFGASIDMLGNAIEACPEELWGDRTQQPEFWYLVYHTLFYLDLYLFGSVDGFAPPPPFGLSELEPGLVLPERVYTREESHRYLEHCRGRCRATIEGMTDEQARARITFDWLELGGAELLLYNMRHVQHHAAQLNLILRQQTGSAPRWVQRAPAGDGDG
ncbi:MAG TPA: DinB family protein, partial [Longimicrobiaceae bacterium]|nr:DinB family protein [Longimicrobiaceae bacterium]